jgi:hypothetical protein
VTWEKLSVAPDCTHHLLDDNPAYGERFDEVLSFHTPGLAPVRRGSHAWHITVNGAEAYKNRFCRTFGYYQGLATVIADDGWHHIDPTGKAIYPQRYDWCGNFQGGLCTVRETDGAYHHITRAGIAAYPQRWRYVGDVRDGIAVVQAPDGRSTHITVDGQVLHGRWFLDLDVFHKGFARAQDEAGWTHIDRGGMPIYTRRFAAVEPFYNGQARVERFDSGLEIIDERGTLATELRPARRSEFAALSGSMVGFWHTQTIAAAVKLGLFEILPGSGDDIAYRCGLRVDRTTRLLRALGELSLVTLVAGKWRLTARGEYLRQEHPLTLADAALEYAGPFSQMWKCLPEAIRAEGDWNTPAVFKDVARDPCRRESHHRMLRSYARHDYPLIPDALPLTGQERVVDAGGGMGTLANLLLDAHPQLQITVLDRPEVIAQARQSQADRPGLTWQAGDLFAAWNVEVEIVILARVLHDWDDLMAIKILHQARAALPQKGRLFIVEMLIPDNSVAGAQCDLHLLMATGGQERREDEYRHLLEKTGFILEDVRLVTALSSVLVAAAR